MKSENPKAGLLAMETSDSILSAALRKKDGSVQEFVIEGFLQHAENLLPLIDRLLTENSLDLKDIGAFLIGRGPGSFTGIRIGFATLKGFLAGGAAAPCFGAMSLDLIAEGISAAEGGSLAVVQDAHRGKLYARLYRETAGRWHASKEAEVMEPAALCGSLPPGTVVAGNALRRYRDVFAAGGFTLAPEEKWVPRASALIRLYENEQEKSGETAENILSRLESPMDMVPLYFRLSEAEERKQSNAPSC